MFGRIRNESLSLINDDDDDYNDDDGRRMTMMVKTVGRVRSMRSVDAFGRCVRSMRSVDAFGRCVPIP
jgi:hypothetical protein